MFRPWDVEPEKYKKEIVCESCGTSLNEHFGPCPKCYSTGRHLPRYVRKEEDNQEGTQAVGEEGTQQEG